MLKALGVDAIHLRSQFPQNTKDLDWIAEVAKNGWILITTDREMNRRRAEKEALREHKVIAFFLRDGFGDEKFWRQAELLCKYWPEIVRVAGSAKPGDVHDVMHHGKIAIRPN